MIRRAQPLKVILDALRPDAGGPEAVERRLDTVNWLPVLFLANSHFVGPAVYNGIASTEHLNEVPIDVRSYFELLHKENRRRNAALKGQLIELVAELNKAGAEPIGLKGCLALLLDLYPDDGIRMIRDLDILIPIKAMSATLNVLRKLGYRIATRYPSGHHAYGDFVRSGTPGAIDLHLEPIDAKYLFSAAELSQRAATLQIGNASFKIPSSTDCILHNVLHAQIHHLGSFYRGAIELRQLLDFAVMARRFDEQVDWDFLLRRMTHHHLGTALISYVLAAHRLLTLSWPFSMKPTYGVEFHYRRCLAYLRVPQLSLMTLPFANLRAAFAVHRMNGLYGTFDPMMARRFHHALQYVEKKGLGEMFRRLIRAS